MSRPPLDLIVVGLGAMGAATILAGARRGARVLGVDAFHPPHDQGSSHGQTRITRRAIGEGLDYVPLAMRSHELWRGLEAETGESLMDETGLLMISPPNLGARHHGKPEFLEATIAAAAAFAIPHEVLGAEEARRRYPQFLVGEHEHAYFEPGAGLLYPELCIAAELARAGALGAEIRTNEAVAAIEPIAGGVRVVTADETYEAGQAVMCAGAWTGALLGGAWAERLTLYRQAMHWFEPDDPAAFASERFPVFIWMHAAAEGEWFYGFPCVAAGGGVKAASEQFAVPTPAIEALDRNATKAEALAAHARHITGRLDGLPPRWLRSAACIYTQTADSRFLIGEDPGRERVLVVSACSGHGFKHAPAIGEAVADWALSGKRPAILAPFALRASV